MEDPTRERYTHSQQQSGHQEIKTVKTGLVVSMDIPWLAASPDDKVYDPTATPQWGLAEYKNPYTANKLTFPEACQKLKNFCLEKKDNGYQLRQTRLLLPSSVSIILHRLGMV